jgi:ABC-2 type transport system permease protein
MSITTGIRPAVGRPGDETGGAARHPSGTGPTFGSVLASEWIKFTTLRSTWILLAVTTVLTAGLPILFASVFGSLSAQRRAAIEEGGLSGIVFNGLSLAQLIIGVLAVLFLSSEYTTGMIRSTMTAVPTRLPVLAAKALIIAVVSYVITTVAVFIAVAVAGPILASYGPGITVTGDVLSSYLLAGVYVAGIALIGLALGELLRNSAGGITSLAGLIFVLPVVLELIPVDFFTQLGKYLPGSAGRHLYATTVPAGDLTQVQGGLVLAAWVVVLLAGAVVSMKRRDV